MSDMLGIASNAIGAYQRALSTVANNISNVNTEGYSRQDVVLKDSAPKKLASMYVGTGTILQNIKRQYDAFAESNLRSSTSDLSSQKPMVDYAKRVMDIMGDKSIGLSSAFDNFFAAASALSAEPASTVQRTSFLRSADGVASRFGELNTQLELIATETREGLSSAAAQVNTLTSQLALINQGLTKSPTLESQPAELLDRRDLTLRQLSDLVRIKTSFSSNGTVKVSLGATLAQGVVVDGNKSRAIGVNTSVKDKIELILDPYGQTESLASASGGTIGGYQSLISQVLDPAKKNLSALAQTFVDETNTIQHNGIDGYGQMGQDLFGFVPEADSQAAGIRLTLNDGMRVATAAQFRISEGNTNITTTRATVKFTGTTPATALSNPHLVNNPNSTAGVNFKVDGASVYTPVTTLSAGVKAAFFMDEAEPGQQLQVLTRDGRQLLGQTLTETEKYQLFTPASGFAANANYSDAYLNQVGDKAYRGIDMFYGAKAEVLYSQNYDAYGADGNPLPLNAAMETSRISSADVTIPAGAITLNGLALPEFNGNAETEIIVAGLDVGTSPTGYTFQAVVGGNVVSLDVTSNDTGTLAQLVAKLNTDLQGEGLVFSTINNGVDLRIVDTKGRDVSGLFLSPEETTFGATSGHVQVMSGAAQVAQWLNGKSEAMVVNPMFGANPNPGFQAFNANIGGVAFELTPTTATDLSSLADELQAQFRLQDNSSTAISVNVDGTSLKIIDTEGRSFKDFILIPADDASFATGGTVQITNSNVSQTQVRAEVFTEVRVPITQLNLSKPLSINNQAIVGFKSVNQLVSAINDSAAGVTASIEPNGELVLKDPLGSPITIKASLEGNALNLQPSTYSGQVRLVQVVRDIRIPATDVNWKKPLQINQINISEAAYQLTDSASYSVEFGYPSLSVSATDAETLVAALNSSSVVSAVQLPEVDRTMSLTVLVDDIAHILEWDSSTFVDTPGNTPDQTVAAKMAAMAAAFETQLDDLDLDATVQAQGSNLVIFHASEAEVTPLELNAVETGSDPVVQTSAGTIDEKFSENYAATQQDGRVVITTSKGAIVDVDLQNSFVLKDADGQEIFPEPEITTLTAFVDRINAKSSQTGVVAALDSNGDLKLSTTDLNGTDSISIGPGKDASGSFAANALGMAPLDFDPTERLRLRLQDPDFVSDIRVSFGSYGEPAKFGDPSDLSKIGLRTGAYIEDGCPDDLLLFVTGKGSANVAVGFEGQPDNVRDSLRTQTLKIQFTATDRYVILDAATGTQLADRHFDPSVIEPLVEFQGLQIKLSHAPAVGDIYRVDGNFDGLGNNVNMLDMVDLNKKPTANGKTIANTYIDQINSVGNLAQQAIITQEALSVVNEQAIAARDKVSGVNLDDEAAALIRYQQAYQACAKALQVSGELFDSIIQIR